MSQGDSVIPILIDCDPGIDDALALFLAAGSAELQLRGVTTVAGNRPVDITALNACRVLDLAGLDAVPVFAGCARPMAHADARCNDVHGLDGLGGVELPARRVPSAEHATTFILRSLLEAPAGTLAIVATGPLSNLALVEILHPGVLRRARSVHVMGGAAFCAGNITPSAEFNFFADPIAAQVVMTSGAKVHLFGLDVTSRAVMSEAWIESLARLETRCGAAAHAMLKAYAALDPLLHDACPVAHLIEPGLFAGRRCRVNVEWRPGADEGRSMVETEGDAKAVDADDIVVYTEVDNDALLALVGERIARLG